MKKNLLVLVGVLGALCLTGCNKADSEYDSNGRMNLNLRNLYFNEWTGGDAYTSYIEEKFNVNIKPTSYSWSDWDQQVYGPVNSNNLTDVFHFDVDSYNFANSYKFWAKGGVSKALPTDLSKWPNVNNLIKNTSSIDNFYIDGKLYCIPIAKYSNGWDSEFSPFTYVYRRDWAKELGVYKDNDVYTWEEFNNLLNAFYKNKCQSGDIAALADVEWGYPSITNFYKTAPHCFAYDETKEEYVCNYTTNEYLAGLNQSKAWTSGTNKYYGLDQYSANEGDINKQFCAGRVGVFYENLSLANYTTIRKTVGARSEITTKEQLDDATAILKVKGPNGKYALEGTENWFSATFFSSDISDAKMEKILDIMDWLLGDEGTMMSLYGIEGYDYQIVNNEVVLLENGWEKDLNGNYIDKLNGAKYLRYMATLGYDTNEKDPLVDQDALSIINSWTNEMIEAKNNNNLRVLQENNKVKWLSTTTKSTKQGSLLDGANTAVIQYCYNKISDTEYNNTFNSSTWNTVLSEINQNVSA